MLNLEKSPWHFLSAIFFSQLGSVRLNGGLCDSRRKAGIERRDWGCWIGETVGRLRRRIKYSVRFDS